MEGFLTISKTDLGLKLKSVQEEFLNEWTYNMIDVVTRNKPKDPIATVPKRDVFIVLPYLGLQSKFITKQLKSCIYKF